MRRLVLLSLIPLFAAGGLVAAAEPDGDRGATPIAAKAVAAQTVTSEPIVAGSITVDPVAVRLTGPHASQQILVEGRRAGRPIDLTHAARFRSLDPRICDVSATGVVRARSDGQGSIEILVAGERLTVPVVVADSAAPRHFNFENDIVPLLSKFGCNASGCHGKAEGQNGFKLSVFGFDPVADYAALTMESRGRRVFPAAPDNSLLLRKAAGLAPHGGGVRIAADSPEYALLRDWIAAGLPVGAADDPKVARVQVQPSERQLAFGDTQQLRVVATYTDGRTVNVTGLAKFQSNNDALAAVDETGKVTAGKVPGRAAIMASFMGAVDVFRLALPSPQPLAGKTDWPQRNFIDPLVYAQLRTLNIAPSEPASDAEYLRRVYLDVIGTLPTAAEARDFLGDKRGDRRARLVEQLLVRPEYADYWALKWADLLRVERSALGHKGAYAFYQWIRQSLAENVPLDQFAARIVTAEGPLADVPEGHFYKVAQKPGEMAGTICQVFLGVRIECAQCHHHPHDRWSQTDYYGMVDFFAPVGRKTSPRGEVILTAAGPQTKHPRSGQIILAHPLGTAAPEELPTGDRRPQLAAWLTAPDNPWFARNLANRLWGHFLGRGLVEPVDDVRTTNPPSNPQLLDALASHLVEHKFDPRALIRAITDSQVYQLSSHPNATNAHDELNNSRALLKRMQAEVLLDAVCQATGSPEKFMGVPAGYRAVQLWDSKVPNYFLKLFGRPARQTACECERSIEPSVAQVLHLLNGPEIQDKLTYEGGTIARLVREHAADGPLTEELYLTFFSRFPTDDERAQAAEYLHTNALGRRAAAEDLAWSMLNSLEFIFNH